jgi:hypothetical protein
LLSFDLALESLLLLAGVVLLPEELLLLVEEPLPSEVLCLLFVVFGVVASGLLLSVLSDAPRPEEVDSLLL